MNNKKNSYKDYKYVYTGYKDYCKDHKIETEKKITNSTKEHINHDHRFKFDFNNPTEHHHDYSFDFNNPNEHHHDYSFDFSQNPQPKNTTANKKTYYTNTYNNKKTTTSSAAKPMATAARTTSTTARTTTTYGSNNRYTNLNPNTKYSSTNNFRTQQKNTQQATKIIKLFFFFFFIFPFIISFLSIFFTAFEDSDYDYDSDYEYEVNENYEDIDSDTYYYDYYTSATSSLCNAIKYNNLSYMKDRITYEELLENDGNYWQNIINQYSAYRTNTIYCSTTLNYDLSISERNTLEEEFYDEYYENIEITEAKSVTIYVRYYAYNQYLTKQHNVVLGRINNKWYFINTKDTEY